MKRAAFFLLIISLFIRVSDAIAETRSILLVPFDADTFVPITKRNIEKLFFRYCDCNRSDESYKAMIKLIRSSRGRAAFLPYGVRARVLLSDGRFAFIDNEGDVLIGTTSKKLDAQQFESLKKTLDSLTHTRAR